MDKPDKETTQNLRISALEDKYKNLRCQILALGKLLGVEFVEFERGPCRYVGVRKIKKIPFDELEIYRENNF